MSDHFLEKLVFIPPMPSVFRRVLSPECVDTFWGIMTSTEATDVDYLLLAGQLTYDEALQYQLVTGNDSFCIQKIADLSVQLSNFLRPKLLQRILNESLGNKKEGITIVFETLLKLVNMRTDLLKDLKVLNHYWDNFLYHSITLIGADLKEMSVNNSTMRPSMKAVIDLCISRGDDYFRTRLGCEFMGVQFYNERTTYGNALKNDSNLSRLDSVINFQGQYSEEEWQKINFLMKENLRFVGEEILYKKIPQTELNSSPEIVIARDSENPGFMYASLCAVRINFTQKKVGFPDVHSYDGYLTCDYGIEENIINFFINPHTGDLCFITGRVPIADLFSSRDRYLALQQYILSFLRDYLLSKEPDVEDLFVSFDTGETNQQEGYVENTEGECNSSVPDSLSEEVYEHVTLKSTDSLQNIPAETLKVKTLGEYSKHQRTLIMQKISSASTNEIFSALRRMFGREESTASSHRFFKSDRTNVRRPVPYHKTSKIVLKLILGNLKAWGYSPIEFAKELGLEV